LTSYEIIKIGVATNKWLLLTIAWECVMLGFVMYLPILRGPFRTDGLTLTDWAGAIFSASTMFLIAELHKLISFGLKVKGLAPASNH
jgi:hypothetical protein